MTIYLRDLPETPTRDMLEEASRRTGLSYEQLKTAWTIMAFTHESTMDLCEHVGHVCNEAVRRGKS